MVAGSSLNGPCVVAVWSLCMVAVVTVWLQGGHLMIAVWSLYGRFVVFI